MISELNKLNVGKSTIKSVFMTKENKLSRITELTNQISFAEKDIECYMMLTKITILALNTAAINFFKADKISNYNTALTFYAMK